MAPRRAIPLAASAACVLAACQNPSATIVGAGPDPIPDLAEAPPAIERDGGPVRLDGSGGTAAGEPTRTASLDRSAWPAMEVRQPRGQVEVQPTYYRLFEGFSADPRANGAYPTARTALSTHGEAQTAVADGFAQPAIGIFWLAGTPVQLVLEPPNTVKRQPADGIQWLPAPAKATVAPGATSPKE